MIQVKLKYCSYVNCFVRACRVLTKVQGENLYFSVVFCRYSQRVFLNWVAHIFWTRYFFIGKLEGPCSKPGALWAKQRISFLADLLQYSGALNIFIGKAQSNSQIKLFDTGCYTVYTSIMFSVYSLSLVRTPVLYLPPNGCSVEGLSGLVLPLLTNMYSRHKTHFISSYMGIIGDFSN